MEIGCSTISLTTLAGILDLLPRAISPNNCDRFLLFCRLIYSHLCFKFKDFYTDLCRFVNLGGWNNAADSWWCHIPKLNPSIDSSTFGFLSVLHWHFSDFWNHFGVDPERKSDCQVSLSSYKIITNRKPDPDLPWIFVKTFQLSRAVHELFAVENCLHHQSIVLTHDFLFVFSTYFLQIAIIQKLLGVSS